MRDDGSDILIKGWERGRTIYRCKHCGSASMNAHFGGDDGAMRNGTIMPDTSIALSPSLSRV